MKINKVTWFEKQLQHKTGLETLKLSSVSDVYKLTMENAFGLEQYDSGQSLPCDVMIGAESMYSANIEPGQHYRLQVNGKIVLFKIATRRIWFFESVKALLAGAVKRSDSE